MRAYKGRLDLSRPGRSTCFESSLGSGSGVAERLTSRLLNLDNQLPEHAEDSSGPFLGSDQDDRVSSRDVCSRTRTLIENKPSTGIGCEPGHLGELPFRITKGVSTAEKKDKPKTRLTRVAPQTRNRRRRAGTDKPLPGNLLPHEEIPERLTRNQDSTGKAASPRRRRLKRSLKLAERSETLLLSKQICPVDKIVWGVSFLLSFVSARSSDPYQCYTESAFPRLQQQQRYIELRLEANRAYLDVQPVLEEQPGSDEKSAVEEHLEANAQLQQGIIRSGCCPESYTANQSRDLKPYQFLQLLKSENLPSQSITSNSEEARSVD